jgi:hypothetical protein
MSPLEIKLQELRSAGWRVAIHNDYRLNGADMTFWLFTQESSGRYVKGEGASDIDAVCACVREWQNPR